MATHLQFLLTIKANITDRIARDQFFITCGRSSHTSEAFPSIKGGNRYKRGFVYQISRRCMEVLIVILDDLRINISEDLINLVTKNPRQLNRF